MAQVTACKRAQEPLIESITQTAVRSNSGSPQKRTATTSAVVEFYRAGVGGAAAASGLRLPDPLFDPRHLGIVDFGGVLPGLRRRLPRSMRRFDSIHADMAAELALASSAMTTPFSWAIFSANNNCAGLAGLEPGFPAVSPRAFLGAFWSRNVRQTDPDFV